MRIIRGREEDLFHLSVANLLDWALKPPAFYTTFPAGWGVLSPSMAQRLKKSGLKAGMPDVLVFYDSSCFGMELKTGKNTMSPMQRETAHKLSLAGVQVHVVRSLQQVLNVLLAHHVPVRQMRDVSSWLQSTNELQLGATSAKRAASQLADAGGGDGTENREAR